MELTLKRKTFTNKTTIGDLSINGVYECHTLEDAVRDVKIQNETAIPYGKYEVKLTISPRFKRTLPLLIDVPNYEGVRIHWGNYAKDTDGCILLGTSTDKDFIGHSVTAFNSFMEKLFALPHGEKINITITK